jgi:hypothetical protein
MNPLIDRFLNPDNYHAVAMSNAARGDIDDVNSGLLILRLCLELRKASTDGAERVVERILSSQPRGYELFQVTTAQMVIARFKNDKSGFTIALDAWLNGRSETPANWDDGVLREPAFQTWLAEVDPDKLKPVQVEVRKLSNEDLSFVQDADAIPLKAVLANLEWLRQMNFVGTPEDIAKQFQLTYVNRYLKEATFDHEGDGPGFTVALDDKGNYVDSFLSH